ncbi:MAG: hypothetical protein LWW85_14880 [Marinilabiliales bacterium]|nr:hypothetical protein [Marinilabiliales bacterium]
MEETKKTGQFTLGDILNGKFFDTEFFQRNRRLIFVVFLMFMAVIAVRFKAAKVLREVDTLESEVKELRAHSIEVSADIIKLTRPSEILDRIKNSNLGLEPSREQPKRIFVKKEIFEEPEEQPAD